MALKAGEPTYPQGAIEELLRELAPQVLGAVVRRHADFDSAEDAVQEALLAAVTKWSDAGVPEDPRGWLIRVASRRMIDQFRSEDARRQRERLAATRADGEVRHGLDHDDTLTVLFLCCHPILSPTSAVALTLRAVGGLTTGEIARAFLVPESSMVRRISRAKQRIKEVPLRVPTDAERPERLAAVLHTLYLIFNEGYTASAGTALNRTDLTTEAIRLTRMLHALMPAEAEVAGLLALMLLTEARRPARTDADGWLVPLAEQRRDRWDATLIDAGIALLTRTLGTAPVGLYQLQAAIAAVHDEAPSTEETDWPQILALYETLEQVAPGPMVTLSRAAAVAMVHGPRAGLALLGTIADDEHLARTHRLDAVRGHLLELAGDEAGAREAYRRAAGMTASLPERRYLTLRAAQLGAH